MELTADDIETLIFRADDGSVSHAVKLVYSPNGKGYVCDDFESQILNRRKAAELLLADLTSNNPDIPIPNAIVFDRIRVLEPNTPREGTVRELIWHFKDAAWNYYIESEGKKVSKRYVDSDIERLDTQQKDGADGPDVL